MMSRSVLEAGHNLASLQLAYKGVDWTDRANWHCNSHQFAARSGKYFGGSMHPFETLFHKAHWETGVPAAEANVLADEMERYSLWLRAAGEGQGAQVSGARRQDEARMPSNATGSGTTTCSMGSARSRTRRPISPSTGSAKDARRPARASTPKPSPPPKWRCAGGRRRRRWQRRWRRRWQPSPACLVRILDRGAMLSLLRSSLKIHQYF